MHDDARLGQVQLLELLALSLLEQLGILIVILEVVGDLDGLNLALNAAVGQLRRVQRSARCLLLGHACLSVKHRHELGVRQLMLLAEVVLYHDIVVRLVVVALQAPDVRVLLLQLAVAGLDVDFDARSDLTDRLVVVRRCLVGPVRALLGECLGRGLLHVVGRSVLPFLLGLGVLGHLDLSREGLLRAGRELLLNTLVRDDVRFDRGMYFAHMIVEMALSGEAHAAAGHGAVVGLLSGVQPEVGLQVALVEEGLAARFEGTDEVALARVALDMDVQLLLAAVGLATVFYWASELFLLGVGLDVVSLVTLQHEGLSAAGQKKFRCPIKDCGQSYSR